MNKPPRPDPLGVEPETVPDQLTGRDRWICWRNQWDSDREEWTKVPIEPGNDSYASSTDPDTWASFASALAYHERNDTDTDGLGFVFVSDDLVVGVDLDDCRDPDTGELEDWASGLVDDLPTYAELSPSGTGLHLYAFGIMPDGKTRAGVDGADGHLEMYEEDRYFTVTGSHVDGSPEQVQQVNDELESVHSEYIAETPKRDVSKPEEPDSPDANPGVHAGGSGSLTDSELIERAKNAENGDKFKRLWNGRTAGYESHSEADLALCGLLAFWTGGDRRQMDRLFRDSGLYRDKWDETRGSQTYGELTIGEALEGRSEFYDPESSDRPTPPPERVDSELVDELLTKPGEWIDPDTQTWTVRETTDHSASEIADALRDGNLPGDGDQALGEAVLSGDLPDDVADVLPDWRDSPGSWTVEVTREFGDGDLGPGAIAASLGVSPDELGEERNGKLAYHVWDRIRAGEHAYVIARMGERADASLFRYDHDTEVWKETGADDLRTLGRDALGQAYTKRVGNELEEQVRTTRAQHNPFGQVHIDEFGAPSETVPVANGILDLTDRDLRRRNPTDYVLAALPVEYDPDAGCPTFEEYLTEVCPRPIDREKLQEYVGYTLMHWELKYHKALFLAGPQASGKSTFLDTVNALLGDETTCSLAPQEMTEERFSGYDLWGAWANIRSDIPSDLIDNTGKFKELVAGDPVKVEKKYEDPITIRPKAKHLFAANTLPQADISDDAFFRRILLVAFPHTIPRDERDPDLDTKLQAELPGILNWALDGLDRLREQGHFSGDLPPAETQGKWESWGDSIARFKERCLDFEVKATHTELKSEVYDAYLSFCEAEGAPAESKQKFGREIKDASGVGDRQVTVDGSQKWAYTGFELAYSPDPDGDGNDQTGLF